MHPIQADILRHLMHHPHRRYTDLKPEEMDPHLFMYHFRKLIGLGLIDKQDEGYVLTREGLRHAGKLSSRTLIARQQPIISTFLACQDTDGRWLLHQRAYQPFLGRRSFPYGKLHWGESLELAARRELRDKTGLTAERLEPHSSCYLRVFEGDELITHMLCHLYRASGLSGDLLEHGEKGPCCWEEIIDPDHSEYYLPGFSALYRLATASPTDRIEEVEVRLPERYAWPIEKIEAE